MFSFPQTNFFFRAGIHQEKSHRPVGRTIYVISAIMAVLVVAFLSIIVYLKVQHSKCALPRSDRASSGSISKSTQSTLQQPSFDLKQSISEIKSCVFNEVRIAMNFTLLFFHRSSKIWQYIKTSYTKLKNSSIAFICMVTRYDFTHGFQSWNHLVQRHKWFHRKQIS